MSRIEVLNRCPNFIQTLGNTQGSLLSFTQYPKNINDLALDSLDPARPLPKADWPNLKTPLA